ncbi:MAG: lipoprotein, partial [bacterium]
MNRIPLVALVSLLALAGCAKKDSSSKAPASSIAAPSAEQVLAEAVTEWNAIKEEAANVLPDAVLLDVHLPGASGHTFL